MTPTEAWYLTCLRMWTDHYGRPPTIVELAGYCDRSHTPVWLAMRSLVAKGHVMQNADEKYVAVPEVQS